MRLWPLAILIACGPSSSPKTPAVGDRENPTGGQSISSDAGIKGEALPSVEIADVLGLTADHVALVRSYEESVRLATNSRKPEAMCSALHEAYQLTEALADPLLTRRDALFDDPAYDNYVGAVDRLSETLRGVRFAVGAETVYASVTHSDFGLAGDESAMAVLAIADELIRPYPAWLVQRTDITGCTRPGGAVPAIKRLSNDAEWAAAPECLRAELGPKLLSSLTAMSDSQCYCDDKNAVAAQVAEVGGMLERVSAVDGKGLAIKLRTSAASSSARFECSP